MIVCLLAAAIASVMAVVASTSVMAQTTGTIPPQPPPYGVAPSQPPPTANQFSSNEIIDAGHHFFGSVSHGLAMAVEKAGACSGKGQASGLTPVLTVRGR